MNVCEALIDILIDQDVRYIFGIPGDAINELIEAIRKQDKIKFIHVMHEEAGAFAASAQAKLSGELSVCVGTAGPGAIHLLNGLYDAKMDHAPVLAITGQVSSALIGTAYHQEVNLQALYEDVSVFNHTIHNPHQMPEVARLAIQNALTKRGVSHLSIPLDISTLKVPGYKKQNRLIIHKPQITPCLSDLTLAAELIDRSVRPCILAGIGAKDAVKELLQFVEKIQAPVIKSLRGKDILPDNHPYTLGGTGLLGTEPAYKATKHCDLFIVIGSDFPYSEFYPSVDTPCIQVDMDASRIGKRHPVNAALVGDSAITLKELTGLIAKKEDGTFLKECQANMEKWNHKQDELEMSKDVPIHPQRLARTIGDLADADAVITCDTGTITAWGARHFHIKGTQKYTLSSNLASMAFGMPAAIGAKLLYKDKQVIAICGDGGFAMLMCDFATAVKYNLNIKVFIFNNSKLGLIQLEEEVHSGNPENETALLNPDYARFADICGGEGYTVKEPAELVSTISKALKSTKPAIINVFVNPEELTMPPDITSSEAFNYVKAKLTEYFIKK